MKNMAIFCSALSITLMVTFMVILEKNENKKEKKSTFECGFDSLSEKKTSFSTNFIMLMMMFLIFDVEISMLIPFMMTSKNNQTLLMLMSNIFIIFLVVLTLKEWKQGSLEWSK